MKQKNKNCINENSLLDINVSNVFVAKNTKKRAFIEQFNYSSVSFTQKNLGTILGFFIVRDEAETSENIVNFLASEIKKKYFSPIQKEAEEKFELTLHHINRVLEEIANIGNIDWLGSIDGAVCVVDSTSIHFSITGNSHILLLRDNALINISEGLSHAEAVENPLKTFVDISSGELCPGDKIIITSQELFDLVPFEELQKNAIRFGRENFIQFIETVLTNECSIATTTVIDVDEKEKSQVYLEPSPVTPVPKNAFSADAFDKEPEQALETLDDIDTDELVEDKPAEYTDPRTGHIHIQGNDEPLPEQTFIKSTQEKSSELFDDTMGFFKLQWNTFSKKISNLRNKPEVPQEETTTDTPELFDDIEDFDDIDNSYDTTATFDTTETRQIKYSQIILQKIKWIIRIIRSAAEKTISYCKKTISKLYKKYRNTQKTQDTNVKQKSSFLPNFHYIKELWHNMSTQTKLITIGILIFIIVVPFIFSQISSKDEDEVVTTENITAQQDTPTEPFAMPDTTSNSQKNINDPTMLLENSSLISTIFMNDANFGITKSDILLLDNATEKSISMPADSGEISLATPMADLDLIFILTTKDQLYSFSPSTKKIKEQKNIPSLNHTKTTALGTYMTYLYTLDDKMIKRYTRIENGFDDGKDWLKENASFSEEATLAIDDDIYVAQESQMLKFNRGKENPFTQDEDIKKVSAVYTTEDTEFIWILDKENDTLFKTEKSTGKKIDEYIHSKFHDASSLTIDEKENNATISTSDNIFSFNLQTN